MWAKSQLIISFCRQDDTDILLVIVELIRTALYQPSKANSPKSESATTKQSIERQVNGPTFSSAVCKQYSPTILTILISDTRTLYSQDICPLTWMTCRPIFKTISPWFVAGLRDLFLQFATFAMKAKENNSLVTRLFHFTHPKHSYQTYHLPRCNKVLLVLH